MLSRAKQGRRGNGTFLRFSSHPVIYMPLWEMLLHVERMPRFHAWHRFLFSISFYFAFVWILFFSVLCLSPAESRQAWSLQGGNSLQILRHCHGQYFVWSLRQPCEVRVFLMFSWGNRHSKSFPEGFKVIRPPGNMLCSRTGHWPQIPWPLALYGNAVGWKESWGSPRLLTHRFL